MNNLSIKKDTTTLRHIASEGNEEALDILIKERILDQKEIHSLTTFRYRERQSIDEEIYRERIALETRKARLIETYLADMPLPLNASKKRHTWTNYLLNIIKFFYG